MSDFGGKLRLARERRGTSLLQISATTKISIAALEALERNDISKLPGGIFSRSFVRSYAQEVGLDPDETVREFLDRFPVAPAPAGRVGTIHPSTPEEESAFESRQRTAGLVLKLVLIGVPLIVVVLYFTMRTRVPVSSATSAPPRTVATSSSPVAVEPDPAAVPIGSSPPAIAVATAGADMAGMTLELRATAECWVRLTVDGKRVLSRLLKEGEEETLEVGDNLVMEVGNAGGFTFSIDGHPGKPLGASGQVRIVTITKDTLSEFLQ